MIDQQTLGAPLRAAGAPQVARDLALRTAVGANGEVIDLYELQQQAPKPDGFITRNGSIHFGKNPEYEEYQLLMSQLLQQQPQQSMPLADEVMVEPEMDETDAFIAELGLTDEDLMELQQSEMDPLVDSVQPQPVGDPVQQVEPVMDETDAFIDELGLTDEDLMELQQSDESNQDLEDEEMVFDGEMGDMGAI